MSRTIYSPNQLDLFAAPPPPPPPPPPARRPDTLAERIIAAGLAHNEWSLNNNRALGDWEIGSDLAYPWNLPSRAFRFPIEFRGGAGKGDGWISLRHPLLHDHPFVIQVGERLGEPVPWRGVDEFNRPLAGMAHWHHACDLMSEKHYRDLLATAQFTTRDDMLRAAAFAAETPAGHDGPNRKVGRITIVTARAVLAYLGSIEPADRSAKVLSTQLSAPSKIEECNSKGAVTATRWPINMHLRDQDAAAWAIVHGVEDGWFSRRRSGYLEWSEAGRNRHAGAAK